MVHQGMRGARIRESNWMSLAGSSSDNSLQDFAFKEFVEMEVRSLCLAGPGAVGRRSREQFQT